MTFKSLHQGLRRGVALGCGAVVSAATLGGALGGCATYRAPTLAIEGVAQTQESPQGLVLDFTLDARNDNEVPLPLREVWYSVELGPGEEWGYEASFTGVRSPEATLRANGTQQIVLPAAIALDPEQTRPTGLVPYRFRARLVYITPGALAETLFDTGVRRPTVTFTKSGMIDFGTP